MEKQKHSALGIASFITSIVSGTFIFLLFVMAGIVDYSTPGGMKEESASAMVIGLLLIAFLCAALVALGLGISGLCQRERKKVFAVLGTVFSAVSLVGTLILVMLGE